MLNREAELSQQEEIKSSNQLINIEGLPKEDVLVALFENVYIKSSASYEAWLHILDLCSFGGAAKAPVGVNCSPSKYEARQILSSRKYVDYVGPVMLKIDFSSNMIDTKHYDKEHETLTNSKIKTAKDCIDQLRHDFEIARKKEAEEKAKREIKEKKRKN